MINKIEGLNLESIEYKLFKENGKEIPLDECTNNNIKITHKIIANINSTDIDKHNPNSDYYNNDCSKIDSELDLTLYDRKNIYNNDKLALCEKDCTFINIEESTNKTICECLPKNKMIYNNQNTSIDEIIDKIDAQKSNSNLKVTKCYINVFADYKRLLQNSGFISLIIVLIIFIIVFIIFCTKGRSQLKQKIENMIHKKFDKKELPKKADNKIKDNNKYKKSGIFNNNKRFNNKKILAGKRHKASSRKGNNKTIKTNSNNKLFNNNYKHNNYKNKINNNKVNKLNILNTINNNKINNNNKNKSTKDIINSINKDDKPDKENDFEMNHLDYLQALKYDKRQDCDIYMSLVKNKQLFLFTFCSFNDYNSSIVRKFVLFLSFAIHFTISALFFNDDTMHQILKDEGKFNFEFMLPHILVTFISSTGLTRIMLETLILTDRDVLKVKHCSTKKEANLMKVQVLKYINIKYLIFFIWNFILLCLFWFYLTCLSDTYEKTQVYIIETTFTAFAFSFVFPFLLNIFPTLLRSYSLSNRKKERECFYTVSIILQLV